VNRSDAVVSHPAPTGSDPLMAKRILYRIEAGYDHGDTTFTVVGPNGERLYSYTDLGAAQAEAAVLESRGVRPDRTLNHR